MVAAVSWLKSRPVVPKLRSRSTSVAVDLAALRQRPGEVVRDGRGAHAALDARDRHRLARERRFRIGEQRRDRADHLHRIDRRNEVFRNAAAHQLAIEPDVVGLAQHDDLDVLVAVLGQRIEIGQQLARIARALDDQQVRRRLVDVVLDRRRNAAFERLHGDVLHAAILRDRPHQAQRRGAVAEGVDGDARNRAVAAIMASAERIVIAKALPGHVFRHRLGLVRRHRRQVFHRRLRRLRLQPGLRRLSRVLDLFASGRSSSS